VACVRHMADSKVTTVVKTFKTTTQELMSLFRVAFRRRRDVHRHGGDRRLLEAGLAHFVDGEFELVLANAAHVKNVPGRKTDVNDATLACRLDAHGLIRASFVPDEPTQQMRDLLRTRKADGARKRSSHIQAFRRRWRTPTSSSISVVTDILGLSGRRIIEALIAGQTMPQALASLAHRRIHASVDELEALAARSRHQASSFSSQAAPGSNRRLRCGHHLYRRGGERKRRALSRRHRAVKLYPRHRQPRGSGAGLRDRHRHEPL